LARAAMIGGTAYVAGRAGQRSANRRQQEADYQQQQEERIAQLEAQQYAQQAPPAAAPQDDLVSRLTELKKLLDAGVLTPEEFELAKQKLIAS
jgi:Short C-terminal domain